ncbi:MAG: PAS domain-containing protein [Phycisphaeraceae bacterium]|nr:PAS domain-containing protein [Phycisphaerales bacterium]MCB9843322.1 PAS domain-containing protein [Phycisphaeraceae bacterium]
MSTPVPTQPPGLKPRLLLPMLAAQAVVFVVVLIAAPLSPGATAGVSIAFACMGIMTAALVSRHSANVRALADAAERASRDPDDASELRIIVAARFPSEPSRELASIAASLRVMSERHAQQLALFRARRNEQDAILQSMDGALIALDPAQHVLSLNRSAERMLGVNAQSASGRLIQECVREPELNDFINGALEAERSSVDEIRLLVHGPRVVRANSARLLDGEGEPVGIIILLTDITELRRLEQVRSDFAANVSHELRTPITNIKGYTETLIESFQQDPKLTKQFLLTIKRNADQMDAIVEDMLLLTRIERPGAESQLAATPTSARSVINAARARLEPESVSRRIEIELLGEPDLQMMVNPRLAEHAVFNLLANAVKYSPADTRIRVTVKPTLIEVDAETSAAGVSGNGGGVRGAGGVEIEVADEGPGIAPEHLPRLWERFYRVDKARSREQGGTGLGLSIVRHIALVHAGRVSVSSTVGRGSRFRIAFHASGNGPGHGSDGVRVKNDSGQY